MNTETFGHCVYRNFAGARIVKSDRVAQSRRRRGRGSFHYVQEFLRNVVRHGTQVDSSFGQWLLESRITYGGLLRL